MMKFNKFATSSIAAAALCAALLTGCGKSATAQIGGLVGAQGASAEAVASSEEAGSQATSGHGSSSSAQGQAGSSSAEGHSGGGPESQGHGGPQGQSGGSQGQPGSGSFSHGQSGSGSASSASQGSSDAALEYAVDPSGYSDLTSFTAQTIDGKTFTQDDFAKADVTLINCWGTFCGYCIEEMPAIASWAKTLPANVQVISLCTDYDSDPESAKGILEQAGFTGATLVAGTGDFAKLQSDIMFLPTTIVVDSSGKVVGKVLEGAPGDVASTYAQLVNTALESLGKAGLNAA